MSQNGQIVTRRPVPELHRLERPVFARSEFLSAGSSTGVHSHPWGQLTYASQGVLEVSADAGSHIAPPNRAVWVPPGLEHSVTNFSQAQMRSLYVQPYALRRLSDRQCKVLEMTPLLRELLTAQADFQPDYPLGGAEERLVAVLLDQIDALSEVDFSVPLPRTPRLRAVCLEFRAAPDMHLTRQDFARRVGMSEKTLARHFIEETGMGFREWRLRLRLLFSLRALEKGESVTAVALNAGYESSSAFIAAFRKRFGRTPGEFFT